MADLLTQLQISLDQLATQFYATASYLTSRHSLLPPSEAPEDPYLRSELLQPGPEDANAELPQLSLKPDTPADFAAAQRELASDLVAKERQIEYLIQNLPGVRSSEEEQEERLRVLAEELRQVRQVRSVKRKETREWVGRLEKVVMDGVANGKG